MEMNLFIAYIGIAIMVGLSVAVSMNYLFRIVRMK